MESQWIEDNENHIYPKIRPLEVLEVIQCSNGQENKGIYFG